MFLLKILCLVHLLSFISSSLTTRPQSVSKTLHESVEFHCGSDASQQGTGDLVPVDWVFSGEKDCVLCSGVLTYKYAGRYSVDMSVPGEYTLRVENITENDIGVYKCIDGAGFGPDEASASLYIEERSDAVVEVPEAAALYSCGAITTIFIDQFALVAVIVLLDSSLRVCVRRHVPSIL